MHRIVIALVRILLIVIVLGCLLAQCIVLPLGSYEFARELEINDVGRIAYLLAAVAALACFEAAVVALWVLLGRVAKRQIFSRDAFRWVDSIIVSALIASVLTLVVFVTLVLQPIAPLGIAFVLFAVLIGTLTFTALVAVMRGLLVAATNLEDELAEVV